MKATVQEGCIGCGLCASTCPEVFAMEDGLAKASQSEIAPETQDCAAQARDNCPVSVIDLCE